MFTHVHERQGAGQSNINQENLFIYASWGNERFFLDGALWGGLFQITQTRDIHMTGFDFTASSKPQGWQLSPHLELGYNYKRLNSTEDFKLAVDPFVMIDWANAWQNSYHETGDSPFNTAQKQHYSSLLRTEAGLRFYETFIFDSWHLTFQEKGSYVNTQSFGTGKINGFLIGSPGVFTVETLAEAQNLGVVQFVVVFHPLKSSYPTSTISYQGELSPMYQSHQANLEVSWNF
jgi:uncharacterized protein with beta-barrel porin domain